MRASKGRAIPVRLRAVSAPQTTAQPCAFKQTAQREGRYRPGAVKQRQPSARDRLQSGLLAPFAPEAISPCQRASFAKQRQRPDAPAGAMPPDANRKLFAGISGYTPAFTRAMSASITPGPNSRKTRAPKLADFNTIIRRTIASSSGSPTAA